MSDAQCDENLAVVVVWGMGATPRREADGENLMLNCQCSRASVLPSSRAGVLPLIGQIGRGALTGGTSVLGLWPVR